MDPRISWFSHLDPSNTAYSPLDPIKYIKIEVPFPYISIKWAYSPCQSIIDDVPIHQKRTSKFPADPERMTKSGKRLQLRTDPPSLRTINQRFLWAMLNSYVTLCNKLPEGISH